MIRCLKILKFILNNVLSKKRDFFTIGLKGPLVVIRIILLLKLEVKLVIIKFSNVRLNLASKAKKLFKLYWENRQPTYLNLQISKLWKRSNPIYINRLLNARLVRIISKWLNFFNKTHHHKCLTCNSSKQFLHNQ